jgi:hypothetical protein
MTVDTYIGQARTRAQAEQDAIDEKLDAYETFIRRVQKLQPDQPPSSESGAASSEQTLRGVVQFLVESGTFYGAVAKGAAAATLLTSGHDESVDDCTLIYDLDDEPAPQLTSFERHSFAVAVVSTEPL